MISRVTVLGLVTLGVAALHAPPVHAQTRAGSQDLQLYAGEIFGDRLTETPVSGSHPLLDDDAVFGGPSRVARVVGGDINLGLAAADLDLLWNITPGFIFHGHRLMPYTELGVGYAWANLGHPLYGVMGTTPMALTDSSGYTANIGIGTRYYMTSNFFVDFDARYRYLSRLIDSEGQELNTGETTLSLGYQF